MSFPATTVNRITVDVLVAGGGPAAVVAFVVAPYTKFVHCNVRPLAVYRSNLDAETHPHR